MTNIVNFPARRETKQDGFDLCKKINMQIARNPLETLAGRAPEQDDCYYLYSYAEIVEESDKAKTLAYKTALAFIYEDLDQLMLESDPLIRQAVDLVRLKMVCGSLKNIREMF